MAGIGRETLTPGSARQFGLVMAGFFVILRRIFNGRGAPGPWTGAALWCGVAAAFAAAAVLAPGALQPLNRLWFRSRAVLHAVVNPLILGACSSG